MSCFLATYSAGNVRIAMSYVYICSHWNKALLLFISQNDRSKKFPIVKLIDIFYENIDNIT